MKSREATGQVSGQVEAHEAQVISPVGWQPESRPEWFNKGGRTFLSANKKLMAGWKTRPPVNKAEAREKVKGLKNILEKIGV